MTAFSIYSSVAANNTATPPSGAPEGMAPSTVNNIQRDQMARMRQWAEDAGWFDMGHTPTYISATSFSVTGDQTAYYTAGRPLRLTGSTTAYAVVVSSAYGSITTVTVLILSGSIDASLANVALSYFLSGSSVIPPQQALNRGAVTNDSTSIAISVSMANKRTWVTSAAGVIINVPKGSTLGLIAETEFEIIRYTSASVTYLPASSVTIVSVSGKLNINTKYSPTVLIWKGVISGLDTYWLGGDLAT